MTDVDLVVPQLLDMLCGALVQPPSSSSHTAPKNSQSFPAGTPSSLGCAAWGTEGGMGSASATAVASRRVGGWAAGEAPASPIAVVGGGSQAAGMDGLAPDARQQMAALTAEKHKRQVRGSGRGVDVAVMPTWH